MVNRHPLRLVVEGYDDLYSVRGIMRNYVSWPETSQESQYPVFIDRGGSVDEILNRGFLSVLLKSSVITTLGIIVDADETPKQRYQRLRSLCINSFPSMPDALPVDGLIVANASKKRLGAWIMPNNQSQGDLEAFLQDLVPNQSRPLWKHAERSVEQAKKNWHAPYRSAHTNKAKLYTWLSWQDPPVQNPGKALDSSALDAKLLPAQRFVRWFRDLYEL